MLINLPSEYTTIVAFHFYYFLNLNPLENGGKNSEKYNKMENKVAENPAIYASNFLKS